VVEDVAPCDIEPILADGSPVLAAKPSPPPAASSEVPKATAVTAALGVSEAPGVRCLSEVFRGVVVDVIRGMLPLPSGDVGVGILNESTDDNNEKVMTRSSINKKKVLVLWGIVC